MARAATFHKVVSVMICLQFLAGIVPAGCLAAVQQQDHLRPKASGNNNAKLNNMVDELQKDGGVSTIDEVFRQNSLWKGLAQGPLTGSQAWVFAMAAAANKLPCEIIEDMMARDEDGQRVRPVPTAAQWLQGMKLAAIIANVVNGGKHAEWATNIQEWMLAVGLGKELLPSERIEMIQKVVASLAKICNDPAQLSVILKRPVDKKFLTLVGDEGGFAPALLSDEEALMIVDAAIIDAGLQGIVGKAIDCAASELYNQKDKLYRMETADHTVYTPLEWAKYQKNLIDKYNIESDEDPFSEFDEEGWTEGVKILGGKAYVVGDDLTTTKLFSLKDAMAKGSIDTILIKVNQNGSISGTLEVIQYALLHGVNVFISHRSGETGNTFITHLLFAATMMEKKASLITGKMPIIAFKAGGFRRSDRIEKYNEELRVETHFKRIAAGLGAKINQPGLSPTTIVDMYWLEVYDSRGNKVMETATTLNNGMVVRASGPSGASTGSTEAYFMKDKMAVERATKEFLQMTYPGKSLEQARELMAKSDNLAFNVYLMNKYVAPLYVGKDVLSVASYNDFKKLETQVLYDVDFKLTNAEITSKAIQELDATSYQYTSQVFEKFNDAITGRLDDDAFVISADAIFSAGGSHAISDLKRNNVYAKVYAWARNQDEEAKLVAMHLDMIVDGIIVSPAVNEVYAQLIHEGYTDGTMALIVGQEKDTGYFKIVNRIKSSPEAIASMPLALAKSAAQTEGPGVKAAYNSLTEQLADKGMLTEDGLAMAQDLSGAISDLPMLMSDNNETRKAVQAQVEYQKLCKEEMQKYI